MKSLSKLFRIGVGPSSSHTIAPGLAAKCFKECIKDKNVIGIIVTFFGSLAMTGIGHHSDFSVIESLKPYQAKIVLDKETKVEHPLTMRFHADLSGEPPLEKNYISLGGGEITSPDDLNAIEKDIYPFQNFAQVKAVLKHENISMKTLCLHYENPGIDEYLMEVVKIMFSSIENGLKSREMIPANNNPRLKWRRMAGELLKEVPSIPDDATKIRIEITSYAYAVAESSASGEVVVTSPTCGSSGVLPSILYLGYKRYRHSLEEIRDSLYIAGMFGNIVKQNASISGAVGGCQAEIGTATSMAASAICYLDGLNIEQQEFAAECSLEHFLGLTCDPVDGYVMIPCIERNGIGAERAFDSFLYAKYLSPVRKAQVSFDNVVEAMKLTGNDMSNKYKETARGGLAALLSQK